MKWVFFSSLYFVVGFGAAVIVCMMGDFDREEAMGFAPLILFLWPLATPVLLWIGLGLLVHKVARGED